MGYLILQNAKENVSTRMVALHMPLKTRLNQQLYPAVATVYPTTVIYTRVGLTLMAPGKLEHAVTSFTVNWHSHIIRNSIIE